MSKKIDIAKAMSKITKLQESIQVILDKVTSATTAVAPIGSGKKPTVIALCGGKRPRKKTKTEKATKEVKPEKKTKKITKTAKPEPKKTKATKSTKKPGKKIKAANPKAGKKKATRRHVELTGE